MKSFLLANVPLSVVHFVLFLIFKGSLLGQPGYTVANALGASGGTRRSRMWDKRSDLLSHMQRCARPLRLRQP